MKAYYYIRLKILRKKIHIFFDFVGKHFNESKTIISSDYAIGQFLDHAAEQNQTGIYGTSSAAQVLNFCDETNSYVSKFSDFLIHSKEDLNSRFNIKKDFNIIYKYCFFLDTLQPWDEVVTDENLYPYFEELINRCLNNSGWGEYFFSNEVKDNHPRVLSTCFALISLKRFPKFTQGPSRKQIIEWLLSQCENITLSIIEKAFSLLVLSKYRDLIETSDGKILNLEKEIMIFIRSAKNKVKGYPFRYHFTVTDNNGKAINHYLFFPFDALLGLSILSSKKYTKKASYLFRVLNYYMKNVEDNEGGFKSDDSGRQSTIDQLWIGKFIIKLDMIDLGIKCFFSQNRRSILLFLVLLLALIIIFYYIPIPSSVFSNLMPNWLITIVRLFLAVIFTNLITPLISWFLKR